jgi:hypothetical protein
VALQSQRLQWTSYRVKYIETVGINELIQFQMVSEFAQSFVQVQYVHESDFGH